ncbi:hypothetical protein AALA22_11725 [Anaerovoracaceae bacterium 41-7]
MLKCEVLRDFRDKTDDSYHCTGSVFQCNEERFEEIQSAGNFLKKIEDDPASKKKKTKEK